MSGSQERVKVPHCIEQTENGSQVVLHSLTRHCIQLCIHSVTLMPLKGYFGQLGSRILGLQCVQRSKYFS